MKAPADLRTATYDQDLNLSIDSKNASSFRSNGYGVVGAEEVQAKFGVKPASLPDLFGLAGDASDNIPGEYTP